MARISLIIAAVALLMGVGCKGPCRQLAENLCQCLLTTADQDSCKQNVANEDARLSPTSDQNNVCRNLLPTCDCHAVNTPEGKIACGLARPLDGGSFAPAVDSGG